MRWQLITKPQYFEALPLAPEPRFQLRMLRFWGSIYQQEADQFSQNPAVQNDEEAREDFANIERDFALFDLVVTRESALWSPYQREEMNAIVERIARTYTRAADRLTMPVS